MTWQLKAPCDSGWVPEHGEAISLKDVLGQLVKFEYGLYVRSDIISMLSFLTITTVL